MIHAMHDEYAEEGEKPQGIQLGAVIAVDLCFVHSKAPDARGEINRVLDGE